MQYPWLHTLYTKLLQIGAQAYLLHGQEYIGKKTLAMHLAKSKLCWQPIDKVACDSCKSCGWFNASTHPDFISVFPHNNVIKVQDIESIGEFSATSGHVGNTPKVVLLYAVENLNKYAANALLKTLEEPASDCIFILVSHRLSGVMPTIRSRCQLFRADSPNLEQSKQWLSRHNIMLDNNSPWLFMFASQPLLLLSVQQQQSDDLPNFIDDIQQLIAGKLVAIEVASKWSDLELDMCYKFLWFFCYSYLQDKQLPFIQIVSIDLINNIADKKKVIKFVDILNKKIRALHLGYNLNHKLSLTSLFIALKEVFE